jgi:hypothetical protein
MAVILGMANLLSLGYFLMLTWVKPKLAGNGDGTLSHQFSKTINPVLGDPECGS